MSVLIKGMDFPISCRECRLKILTNSGIWACRQVTKKPVSVDTFVQRNNRHPDCPLVEVPTPHGDLIDKKRIMFELGESTMTQSNRDFCKRVLESDSLTPIIIGAEDK